MCDLVEGSLRFVMVHSSDGDRVYWIRDTTGTTEALVLSCIALYAATNLAQNMSSLVSKTLHDPPPAWAEGLNVLACLVSVGLLVGMCDAHREYYVSQRDFDLYAVLLVFLACDFVLLALKKVGPRDSSRNFGHQVGLSTVVLLLVTLRLHNTFNTPFLPVLLGLFGMRAACKLLQHIRSSLSFGNHDINLVSVLFDLGVWSWLLVYSLAHCLTAHDHLAVGVNLATALLLGLAMAVLAAEE